ncbi:hypothetical protein YYC_02264 [Plasmodium yoelii 17X]|uniref:Uncharacterized protein n=1 Tax=Plasmodium yoelii 17X TaxID=1323249 RepID=V7PMK5_PLAYE|nr:hypothetical protein YYC_02264 [Plasmodium yoelii 17X]
MATKIKKNYLKVQGQNINIIIILINQIIQKKCTIKFLNWLNIERGYYYHYYCHYYHYYCHYYHYYCYYYHYYCYYYYCYYIVIITIVIIFFFFFHLLFSMNKLF